MSDLSTRFADFIGGLSDEDARALLELVEHRVAPNRPGAGESMGGEVVPIAPPTGLVCANCGTRIGTDPAYASPYKPPRKFVYVLGVRGVEETEKIVCRACYRVDFAKVYPNERLPV